MTIAFQGIKGAYSEEAAYSYIHANQDSFDQTKTLGFVYPSDVCEAVENNQAAWGILPIENSIVGSVGTHVDLFYKHNIFAIGEVYLPIHHHLLALPGTQFKDIKQVYSHPVALDQCRDFFVKHSIETIPVYDTAGAAKLLREKKISNAGTISSLLCAKYYNLEIVNNDIQKVKNNFTRFFLFKKGNFENLSTLNLRYEDFPSKTSIAFITKHHPGALLSSLQVFANHKINLTKLESRPIPEDPFAYVFYVDFQGTPHTSIAKKCIEEIKEHTQNVKILGIYRDVKKIGL